MRPKSQVQMDAPRLWKFVSRTGRGFVWSLSMASCGQTENPTWGFAINRCWEADAIGVVEDRVCE